MSVGQAQNEKKNGTTVFQNTQQSMLDNPASDISKTPSQDTGEELWQSNILACKIMSQT